MVAVISIPAVTGTIRIEQTENICCCLSSRSRLACWSGGTGRELYKALFDLLQASSSSASALTPAFSTRSRTKAASQSPAFLLLDLSTY